MSQHDNDMISGKAYDLRLIKRLWPYVRPHKKLFLLAMLLIPVGIGFELAQPYILKVAIEDHIEVKKIDGLAWLCLLYLGMVVAQSLASYAQTYVLHLVGQRSMHDLRKGIYAHTLSQGASFFDRIPVGRLMTRMTNDVESINEMFASGVVTLLADAVKLIAIVVIMFTMSWKLTLATFITLPALLLLVNWARRSMRSSYRIVRQKLSRLNTFTQEYLTGLSIVQLFGRQKKATQNYSQISGEYRDAYLKSIYADASMYAWVEAIGTVSIAGLILWVTGSLETTFTVGIFVAFIEYVNKFYVPIRDLSAKYAVMQSAMAATERITELLDTRVHDAPVKPTGEEHQDGTESHKYIDFSDVTFAYTNRETVLNNISFSIAKGQTVALVGATGSGKSTLIKLLTRLYEPIKGTITLAHRNLATLDKASVRSMITLVTQDVFLFKGTLAENLRQGNPSATREELNRALSQVGALELLSRNRPEFSLDMKVEAKGENFSAGERQLISFARAILRDPEILILDEATAHVDPESEAILEKGVATLLQDRTSLVIAHRLSTIQHADQILVLSKGRVAESGNREQLIAQQGIYAALERTFLAGQH